MVEVTVEDEDTLPAYPVFTEAMAAALAPLAVGSEAIITGGHRKGLEGSRVLILPSTDPCSRNVRLLSGPEDQQRRTLTLDVTHLKASAGVRAQEDDGLPPCLRWQLTPPPLTVYTARFLLGWVSMKVLVPPAAPERDGGGKLIDPPLQMTLPTPWSAHRAWPEPSTTTR